MVWYVVLGVAAVLLGISILLPTTRRIWAFHLYALKQVWIRFTEITRLRRLYLRARGIPYRPYSRPVAMRRFCEDMGPTFIKFGQIVASSAGLFPKRYSEEFQKCLDRVRPFSFEEVRQILEEELGPEKAAELVDIDPTPLASASIAQVHTAELADGTKVVVKVQRPGIQARCASDMRIMRATAAVVAKLVKDAELANPVGIVEDFAMTLAEELDFRKEAANLDEFNRQMKDLGHNDVRAPKPNWDYTTPRVLVMERFFGVRVDRVDDARRAKVDAEERLVKGMRAWFQSVLFYGFFHGDVHAGNLMLLDNDDIGFLDFGIVGRFDERQKFMVTDYVVAFASGDYKALAKVIIEMGGVNEGLDMDVFVKDLETAYSPMLKLSFAELNYADLLPSINRVASKHRMRMPREFILITKQMLYFDRYAKILAPKLNVFSDPRLVMSLMTDIQKARAMRTKESAKAGA